MLEAVNSQQMGSSTIADDFKSGVTVSMEGAGVSTPGANICLNVMDNLKDVELAAGPCAVSNPRQVWYYTTDGHLGMQNGFLTYAADKYGAAQIRPVDAPSAVDGDNIIQFMSDGKIMNPKTQLCLQPGTFGATLLQFADCARAPSWHLRRASLSYVGVATMPKIEDSMPQVIPASPSLNTPVVPVVPQVASNTVPAASQASKPQVVDNTPKAVISYKGNGATGTLTEKDHYLCICVVDKDDDKCVQAVSAACTVGHIPSELCKQSFEDGDHDAIAKNIVELIENGERCSTLDSEKIRKEFAASKLPVQAFHGQQLVTAEDHYLCVCLANGGDTAKLDKQCEDAVRVACMVGHIPETECFASFDEQNHAMIVERIMRMIDRGANCAQKLQVHPSKTCEHPPCYHALRHSSHEPTSEDHYLCPCMDDHQSEICYEAVKKACKLKHIPAADCELAEKANYRHAVTRHVLHLIDHGAECGLADSMTFTNRGCHCKNKWTAMNGETLELPNNCNDPGGEKGFDWCETFPEEGCVGVGDSMSWDRCDAPRKPRYHPGQFVSTAAGRVSPVDHYLCVCVDKGSNDEVCVAAVKAACHVGHIEADACAKSFEHEDHTDISDHVLSLIMQGARCNNVELSSISSMQQVPRNNVAGGCGHGTLTGTSTCECQLGYAGSRCNYCALGYVGYPLCKPKLDCSPACRYGSCDFETGTCRCPANRAGTTCGECASGYSGAQCTPAGLFGSGPLATLFMFAACVGATYLCCCTPLGAQLVSTMPGSTSSGGKYSRLNNFDEDEDIVNFDDDDDDDNFTHGDLGDDSDFFSKLNKQQSGEMDNMLDIKPSTSSHKNANEVAGLDISNESSSSKNSSKAKQAHNGLAI